MFLAHHLHLGTPTVRCIGTFLITVAAGALIAWLPKAGIPRNILALLGRSALLVFILHRLVLHMLVAGIPSTIPREVRLLLLLPIGISLLILACWYKERTPGVAAKLKRVGL